ncbi:MAG TPA: hypothetical protein VMZ03_11080 [Chitinophagaceae bacterium]|nr:hypothetical protein [Chitinophagaceae bacterium]
MKNILYFLIVFLSAFLVSCNNGSADKKTETRKDSLLEGPVNDTAGNASVIEQNEEKKAGIEAMSARMTKKEVMLNGAGINASIRQKWMKMDVYRDSSGMIRRIKLYPHKGISERSEEFYYDNNKLFFVYVSDKGVDTEDRDEGQPGKEFHFAGGRLIKYEDRSGDKESIDKNDEDKVYELELMAESKEFFELAEKNK